MKKPFFIILILLSLIAKSEVNLEQTREQTMTVLEELIEDSMEGNPESQTRLGNIYYDIQDYEKAFYWYEKSANQEEPYAQTSLGVMYQEGEWVPQDYKKAFYWYKKAANLGVVEVQFTLGNMYHLGIGTPQDYKKAFYWYEKAANLGVPKAQFALGSMYQLGQGVSKDSIKAYAWINIAATEIDLAKESRDFILEKLTPEEIEKGQKLANKIYDEINK